MRKHDREKQILLNKDVQFGIVQLAWCHLLSTIRIRMLIVIDCGRLDRSSWAPFPSVHSSIICSMWHYLALRNYQVE
ncbi:unnamed protein product [Lactuca virosa]|uniref:Uncharacterized protein n=1 Tax=Lactuca virosa TaxID=75947 RepID=A0AAU9MF75_9ASTR|nr:unnamed protein product [Lactuca virosa]